MPPAQPRKKQLQPQQQPTAVKTRRASSSQQATNNTNLAVADAEDSKRVANRLAQRKFRRQRKDYIAYLENELALCREGASEELTHRRQEVAKLHEEKAELRELLEHVAVNLSRICGVEISIGGDSVQKQRDAPLCPVTPSRTDSQNGDAQSSGSRLKAESDRNDGARGSSANRNPTQTAEDLDREDGARLEPINTSKDLTASILEAELELIAQEPPLQVDGRTVCSSQHMCSSINAPTSLQNELPVDLSMIWTQDTYQPDERCSDWAQDQEQEDEKQEHNRQLACVPQKGSSHFMSSSNFERLMSDFGNFLQAAPGTLRNICRSSGCSGRHNGSDKTNLMSMILRRQVDEVVDSCSRMSVDSLQSMQILEGNLVNGLIDIILSISASATQLLGLQTLCLCGANAWYVWQIVKTFWVLPRLADAGIVAAAAELGFESDVFRDTMPHWMRPTDIQKTFEHSAAIDFIPWARLREALIVHQDDVPIDDIFINVLTRGQPTGADTDRLVDLSAAPPWESIRRQFQSSQDRLLRDSFYGSMSIWKLKKESQYPSGTCTNLLVDSMMAPASSVMMTS